MSDAPATIRRLTHVDDTQIRQLADVLIDCVEGGASVSFMHPLAPQRALAFWRGVAEGAAAGQRALLVAQEAGTGCIVGTVQLLLDLPENQPHRADVAKLLVHRRARRQGLARRLMQALDAQAQACGRTVLVLDTAVGGGAEPLYQQLGWQRVGPVPRYALMPDGSPCDTCFYYKHLPML
jgi:GNAT superfamily N-acetyltransferase